MNKAQKDIPPLLELHRGPCSPNAAADWSAAPLFRIQKVPGSELEPETGHPTVRGSKSCSLLHPFHSLLISHSVTDDTQ